jgi:hypothetical protein
LRGILNSGHTKAAAYVIRTVEISGEHVAKRFSTWAPKAIATIGDLADTLADRSITINMQRKRGDQHVERLRRRDNAEFAQLRRMALRWANDNTEAISERALILPPEATHALICVDNDGNGVGQRAAHDVAERWLAEGRRVRVAIPPEPDTDFNDVLTTAG